MLRLGLFNFKNDDVLLLTGNTAEMVELGQRLHIGLSTGSGWVAIHTLAKVSVRHPVLLFAARGDMALPEKDTFVWRCPDADIQKLLAAGSAAAELYFDLTTTPPFLYVSFSGHYDDVWWSTYG
jgi:hypothetical protein